MSKKNINYEHFLYKTKPVKLFLSGKTEHTYYVDSEVPIDGTYWLRINCITGWRKGKSIWVKYLPSAKKDHFYSFTQHESKVPRKILEAYAVDSLLEC